MRKILLFVFTAGIISSCIFNGQLTDCFRSYIFDFPVSVYPVNDTINIGDTLWVEINIDNLIEDKETGEMIDISDFDLHFIMFNSRYDNPYVNNSIGDFDFHLEEGELQISQTRSFILFENNNSKRFKMGIIPKNSGGQLLSISYSPEIFDGIDFGDKCIEYNSEHTMVVINQSGERNIEQLEGLYLIVSDLEDTLYYGTGNELEQYTDAYAFYVQE